MTNFAHYPSLEGRAVIVTGGASGIGAAFVRGFARNGARVAFLDLQAAAGEALAKSVAAEGLPAPVFVPCDLGDIPALKKALGTIRDMVGPASTLVNNAADDRRTPLDKVTVEEFDRMVAVNFRHVFFAAQEVAPQMRELGRGSIVNLSSGSFVRGVKDLDVYASCKAAIVGLTNQLARELGPHRIRVNAIMPGLVLTEKQRRMWFPDEASIQAIVREQMLPDRLEPADIANMALFLAADDSRLITKQVFPVNAGLN